MIVQLIIQIDIRKLKDAQLIQKFKTGIIHIIYRKNKFSFHNFEIEETWIKWKKIFWKKKLQLLVLRLESDRLHRKLTITSLTSGLLVLIVAMLGCSIRCDLYDMMISYDNKEKNATDCAICMQSFEIDYMWWLWTHFAHASYRLIHQWCVKLEHARGTWIF